MIQIKLIVHRVLKLGILFLLRSCKLRVGKVVMSGKWLGKRCGPILIAWMDWCPGQAYKDCHFSRSVPNQIIALSKREQIIFFNQFHVASNSLRELEGDRAGQNQSEAAGKVDSCSAARNDPFFAALTYSE